MGLVKLKPLDVKEVETLPVLVRNFQELSKDERSLLGRSGLGDLAPVEAWVSRGTNRDLSYATHGLFRYFGKFPPPIATHLIRSYTSQGDLVVDPMCGSGTTGVECLLLKRRGVLSDVSPLSLLLSKVKTTYIPSRKLTDGLKQIISSYKSSPKVGFAHLPVGLRNANHWFLPSTTRSLRKLRTGIDEIADKTVRDFFLVVFASIVRKVSRATTQQGRLFLDAVTAQKDALPAFIKRAESSIEAVSRLPHAPMQGMKVWERDVRTSPLPGHKGLAKLAILHPPYFNGYKYSTINALELSWLGYALDQVRSTEIREFFKVGKKENLQSYNADMHEVLLSAYEYIAQKGRLAVMIGDTMIHGNHIQVIKPLLDSLPHLRSKIEKIVIRVPRHTEASWVASQRRNSGSLGIPLCDFILIFKK